MQNQKVFVRRDAHTHTHTQTLQDESKARKWIICQRIGKLKVNNGVQTKPSQAKPSQTQQI